MEHTGSADDRVGPEEADLPIEEVVLAIAIVVGLNIAQVADMARSRGGTCVKVPVGVVVGARCDAAL